MTVLSWNMLFSNQRPDEALAFIRDCGADIICLQEVPDTLLGPLRTLPHALVSAIETSRRTRSGDSTQHLVILSRWPIARHALVPLPERAQEPLRTSLFASAMIALGLWGRAFGERHQLIADIAAPEGIIRAVNVHLPLARSSWRAEEFECSLMNVDRALPTIICGDFNILESRRIAPLYWLLGGTIREVFFWRNERGRMEERFAAHELANPLRGSITHPTSRSQLDHILCSKHFIVNRAQVVANRHGSDHHPVLLALDYI